MNYLAHAYLSFEHPQIMVGNMISDFVKGRDKYLYPAEVQKGIALHRSIDTFTDTHSATHQAKEIFRPDYRLYSGPIMDIIYDHFLANDKSIFEYDSLMNFTSNVYKTLEEHAELLPPRFLHVLTYMKTQNWLWNYQFNEGIEISLRGLARRSAYLSESATAYRLFLENRHLIQEHYNRFIKDVKLFAKEKFDELIA